MLLDRVWTLKGFTWQMPNLQQDTSWVACRTGSVLRKQYQLTDSNICIHTMQACCVTILTVFVCSVQADIILMCANAKVFNHPNTKPHKEADTLFKYSMKYVSETAEQSNPVVRCLAAGAVKHFSQSCSPALQAVHVVHSTASLFAKRWGQQQRQQQRCVAEQQMLRALL